jgi:hypothetical protein
MNGKRRGREPYVNGKSMLPLPGDEIVGAWSREQLEAMDAKFRQRVERAFENGSERRQPAAMNGAHSMRPR